MLIAYAVSAVGVVLGLLYIVFTFVDPPTWLNSYLNSYLRGHAIFYFLPDTVARILFGLLLIVGIPLVSNVLVAMILG